MDKEFMKGYVEKMYEDIVADVIKDSTEYEKLRVGYIEKEKAFYQCLIKEKPEWVEMYEIISKLLSQMENIIYIGLYLRGAEDRERMLK